VTLFVITCATSTSHSARSRSPAASFCVSLALIVAERVTRATSPAVLSSLTRVFGLLLSAIAVQQLVVDGVRSLT
jgi:small neutral amino acid transporter SnatA (MarC family)